MSNDEPDWRSFIVTKLRDRNIRESGNYKSLISQNNHLIDTITQLKADNLRVSVENEQLRTAISSGTKDPSVTNVAIAALEKKLLTQQEELTALHKRKGENAQMIVDLNMKVERQNKLLAEREHSLAEQTAINNSLRAEINMFKSSMEELKSLNTILRDEHTALQLAFASLEEKHRKIQDENRTLVERIIKYKAKDADKLNEENESFLKLPSFFYRKRSDKVRRDLEEAARENRRSTSPISIQLPIDCSETENLADNFGAPTKMTGFYSQSIPNKIHCTINAHDGEVNAVRWSPVDRIVATGGADRKVKLWDVGKSDVESRGVLVGSNASVNSVDFDSTGSMLLGTSNDFATRVWTVADQRLRHTLTGHSGKVMAAKFLQEPSKVVTGSHDRTLKIWDLRSKACIETKFAGSSCNDLVTTDSLGSTIISGHFDKKIRFWDTRADHSANDILMPARITSLDLSKDRKYLLSCVRDDTIKLLDLRMNQIIGTFSHDDFKVGCDWSRVAFNNDATKVAAGAADGAVLVWNVNGRLEATLKNDKPFSVNAVSWHPFSSALASVDKGKRCVIWIDE